MWWATLAIAGIFPFAGFWSKDEILAGAIKSGGINILWWLVGLLTAFLTAFYMFRLFYLTFYGTSRVEPHVADACARSASGDARAPHAAGAAVAPGRFCSGFRQSTAACIGCSEPVFAAAEHLRGGPHHFGIWDVVLMLISLAVAIAGWRLARRVYVEEPHLEAQWIQRWQGYYTLLVNKYYVDEVYARLIVRPLYALSESLLWRIFDIGVIDRLVNAVARFVSLDGEILSHVQTGYVRTYALTLVAGAVMHARGACYEGCSRMAFPLLSSVLFLPLLGAIVLAGFPRAACQCPALGSARGDARDVWRCRWCCIWCSIRPCLGCNCSERVAWISSLGISYHIGVDGISLPLVLLTTFLSPLAFLGAWHSITTKVKEFAMFMLLLETAMLGAFLALDLFLFFIFWEAMLIPMYFIIGIWGGENRLYATVKFILYTMAGSAVMLVAILALYVFHQQFSGQLSFDLFDLYRVPLSLAAAKVAVSGVFLEFCH